MPDTYYICGCGRSFVYSRVQPPACQPCPHCGTNLAHSRELCAPSIEHEMYEEEYVIDQNGSSVTMLICKHCGIMSPDAKLHSAIV